MMKAITVKKTIESPSLGEIKIECDEPRFIKGEYGKIASNGIEFKVEVVGEDYIIASSINKPLASYPYDPNCIALLEGEILYIPSK